MTTGGGGLSSSDLTATLLLLGLCLTGDDETLLDGLLELETALDFLLDGLLESGLLLLTMAAFFEVGGDLGLLLALLLESLLVLLVLTRGDGDETLIVEITRVGGVGVGRRRGEELVEGGLGVVRGEHGRLQVRGWEVVSREGRDDDASRG